MHKWKADETHPLRRHQKQGRRATYSNALALCYLHLNIAGENYYMGIQLCDSQAHSLCRKVTAAQTPPWLGTQAASATKIHPIVLIER